MPYDLDALKKDLETTRKNIERIQEGLAKEQAYFERLGVLISAKEIETSEDQATEVPTQPQEEEP